MIRLYVVVISWAQDNFTFSFKT